MQNDRNYVPGARAGREILGMRGQGIYLSLQLLRQKELELWGLVSSQTGGELKQKNLGDRW